MAFFYEHDAALIQCFNLCLCLQIRFAQVAFSKKTSPISEVVYFGCVKRALVIIFFPNIHPNRLKNARVMSEAFNNFLYLWDILT